MILLITLLSLFLGQHAAAGSATWSTNPGTANWNTPSNWTPATVPNGPTDIATFDISSINVVSLTADITVDSIIFDANADAYTINTGAVSKLTLSGAGILNNSSVTQNILIPDINGAQWIYLQNGATFGSNIIVTNNGNGGVTGADMEFHDFSSAGDATFTNNGSIYFFDHASAGRATFINNPPGAVTYFSNPGFAHAERATFINNGATIRGTYGGWTGLYNHGTLGHSTVIVNGGTVAGAPGGNVDVGLDFHSDNGAYIANGGTNGGQGGSITFINDTDGGSCRVQVFGNGYLDLRYPQGFIRSNTIGSLEGDGFVYLGPNKLLIGSANRDTSFSGEIVELGSHGDTHGSIEKIGTGTLVLRRPNSYNGGTVVSGGTLIVNNQSGSGTGDGPVAVNAGMLSGVGQITGAVTIGTGSGPGAQIAPGKQPVNTGLLIIRSTLTFNSDGSYGFGVNTIGPTSDEVVANGVTINPGAQFVLTQSGSELLPVGTSILVIENTSGTPIDGFFSNLADGGTITAGNNTYQVNYEGGDGNDLTLMVVP